MPDEATPPRGRPGAPPSGGGVTRKAAHARLEAIRTFGSVGTAGLAFVFAVVIGAALGWWIDRQTGWSPVGFFAGFGIGVAAGVRSVYVIVRRYLK